jgi:hypothetical protein
MGIVRDEVLRCNMFVEVIYIQATPIVIVGTWD